MLAAQIAQEPAAGLYNGLIVAAFLGATINGTIPLALGRLTGSNEPPPFADCFSVFWSCRWAACLPGHCAASPVSSAAQHLACAGCRGSVAAAFKSGSSAIGPIFNGISLAVRGLTLFGFCISVLQETTGIVLLEGLTPWRKSTRSYAVSVRFLPGSCRFRLCAAPADRTAGQAGRTAAAGACLHHRSGCDLRQLHPTLLSLDTLEERGITLNTAYAVVAAYSVGDFLAFTLQFSPTRTADDGRPPFKRLAGSSALPENNTQNHLSKPPNGQLKPVGVLILSFPVSIHDKGTAEAVPLTVVDLCLMAAALDVFGQFLPQV